jgi:hypothetical protein
MALSRSGPRPIELATDAELEERIAAAEQAYDKTREGDPPEAARAAHAERMACGAERSKRFQAPEAWAAYRAAREHSERGDAIIDWHNDLIQRALVELGSPDLTQSHLVDHCRALRRVAAPFADLEGGARAVLAEVAALAVEMAKVRKSTNGNVLAAMAAVRIMSAGATPLNARERAIAAMVELALCLGEANDAASDVMAGMGRSDHEAEPGAA